MISENDLDAFGYYDQIADFAKVEAQQAVAMSVVEKTMRMQNETLQASVVAFEMALDWATAPMRAAAALSTAEQPAFPVWRGPNVCL